MATNTKTYANNPEYYDFLKKEIALYCNQDKQLEYQWDRDNEAPVDLLREAYRTQQLHWSYDYHFVPFTKALEWKMRDERRVETVLGRCDQKEAEFIAKIKKDAEQEDPFVQASLCGAIKLFADLKEAGYQGVNYNVDQLLSNTEIKLNLILGTAEEANSLFTHIGPYFSHKLMDVVTQDNALVYFIHQQQLSVRTILETVDQNPRGIESPQNWQDRLVNEIVSMPTEGALALTACVNIYGDRIAPFFDNLILKKKNIEFELDGNIGLFDPFRGGGSNFELSPWFDEEDGTSGHTFIISPDMIKGVQMEGVKDLFRVHVSETYGTDRSMWQTTCVLTDEKPSLKQENMIAIAFDFSKEEK